MFWKKAAPPAAEPPRLRRGQVLSNRDVYLRSLDPYSMREIVRDLPPRLPDEGMSDWLKRIDASRLEWSVCLHLKMMGVDPSAPLPK